MRLHLNIYTQSVAAWENHPTYTNAEKNGDVGLDIPLTNSITIPPHARSFKINLGFRAEQTHGYMLVPRSSISKTSIRMANSIGIIDQGYEGIVIAAVDNLSDEQVVFEVGKCYFQIVAFDGTLPTYLVNKESSFLPSTSRGDGGFGSTTTALQS